MKIVRILSLLSRNRMCISYLSKPVNFVTLLPKTYTTYNVICKRSFSGAKVLNSEQDDIPENDYDADFENYLNYSLESDQSNARDLLYQNSDDPLLNRIYHCVSVQELLNVFRQNVDNYKIQHALQTIFGLSDLKEICTLYNGSLKSNDLDTESDFLTQLHENENFIKLLKFIEGNIKKFSTIELSYVLFYLNKLGLPLNKPLIDSLTLELEEQLVNNFSIAPASRYLTTIYSEYNLSAYFKSQSIVPLVFKELEVQQTLESFGDLTTCLNKLHHFITDEIYTKYINIVIQMLEAEELNSSDYSLILTIISFLNYPKWRDKSSSLISKCILVLKNNLYLLNVKQIIVLYDIFFKIQEPGVILNELQRCSSRFLQQMEDTTYEKIKLFSSLIYFTSPHNRIQYQKSLKKYVQEANRLESLLELRKILSYVKVSDLKLCQLYWNRILKLIDKDTDILQILRVCQNYINFCSDIEDFRDLNFESEILILLENLLPSVYIYPHKLTNILCFALLYSSNDKLLLEIVNNIESSWMQLSVTDCLRMASTLRIFAKLDNKYIKSNYANKIELIVKKIIEKEKNCEINLWQNYNLIKASLFSNVINVNTIDELLLRYNNLECCSSKFIENLTYFFMHTSIYHPQMLNKITDYIIDANENILTFNLEKVLYLCYSLGHHPKNSEKFFRVAANLITRDQERLSGLTLIHSALALCYFNKLPKSLIQSIFNVEFMDKLDTELSNCYSKDTYPQRVRGNLMQLNRAVCLDYPDAKVPWFHQKYVDGLNKEGADLRIFPKRVKEYLVQLVKNEKAIIENVITPYGYRIDFVINLNSKDEVVAEPSTSRTKIALLLLQPYAFTRIFKQLRGKFQLKKRHLEILGYQVILVNGSDWSNLYHPEEKQQFLHNLIWPQKKFHNVINIER